ncbi:MAG TPA: class I mannose-6-phosphate isomerase [Bacteroidota bacterium]|nr:class I mannose-6-phosphate isomerase [Bacteroidota bacterium]
MSPTGDIVRAPILLAPNRVRRMYRGGAMIALLSAGRRGEDTEFPEEWVGSTVQARNPGPHYRAGEGLALIASGDPLTLRSVIEAHPEEMLGAAHVGVFGTNAALLVKLLDTAVRLMIHAHPSQEFAARHLGTCFGKTEAWFVLGTRPETEEPSVYIAFREEVSRGRYRAMIDAQDTASMLGVLHRVPVKPGDVVYVRAGLPHAIGAGVFMVELQEPTDFSIMLERGAPNYTFRPDESFLGLDESLALSAVDHRVYRPEDVRRELVVRPRTVRAEGASTETELLGYDTTGCFAGRRLEVTGSLAGDTQGRYFLLIVLDGEGTLRHSRGETRLARGMQLFVPASVGTHEFRSDRPMVIFKSMPADVQASVS